MGDVPPNAAGHPDHLERLDPAQRRDHQAAQHWARYEWACQFLPAARVLDCACGVGYGSALLRTRGAGSVLGVDISSEALDQAAERYSGAGIEYLRADVVTLSPQGIGQFDLIVSLETIEHVPEPQRLLDVFGTLLKPDGILALSCPNDVYLGVENPYHLWRAEYRVLEGWLRSRFRHVGVYGELHTFGTGIWPVSEVESRADLLRRYPVPTRAVDSLPLGSAPGFLFACGNVAPPRVGPVAAEVLGGNEYIRDLERVRDHLWQENQRLGGVWSVQNERIHELELEKERLWLETQRLGQTWEQQNARIAELEAEKNRIWQEAQRLAGEWEIQVRRCRELQEAHDRLLQDLRTATARRK